MALQPTFKADSKAHISSSIRSNVAYNNSNNMSIYHDNPNSGYNNIQDNMPTPIQKASMLRNGPQPLDVNNAVATPSANYSARSNPPGYSPQMTPIQRLSILDEQAWYQIGSMAESMGDYKQALKAYENAPKHNPYSLRTLQRMALLYRQQEDIKKAIEMYQRIISIDGSNGETWGALGHCYLMVGDLPKTYQAYQQALNHISDTKDPKLWYGIGILYECYNAYDSAEEAFIAVMQMDPKFEKSNEIYFRLGIIHKCQQRYKDSLDCFKYILNSPPKPLNENDVWFQIGNVHELQGENDLALNAYKRILTDDPNHGKALLHIGMLFMKPDFDLYNPDNAFRYLSRSTKADKADPQAWYILGRCEMLLKHYNSAYEAYQKAVYCEPTNPIYWCSIGVLYFQINQFRDSLDAYSRSIKLDPVNREVWFNLGTLYEACNSQTADAIDAYYHASQLDPKNAYIIDRLNFLKSGKSESLSGAPMSTPQPIEISISDLQTISMIPTNDPEAQSSIPGNLGRPPVPIAPSSYPPKNEMSRLRLDEHDHYQQQIKEPIRGGNRIIAENDYPSYPDHTSMNDQDKSAPPPMQGRISPPTYMRNSEGLMESEGMRRGRIPRGSPINTGRNYGYPPGPNNLGTPNVNNPIQSQHRMSESIQAPNPSMARNANRQPPQPINKLSQKQDLSYSPVNSYQGNRRSSVVIRGSPPNYSTENGPNPAEADHQTPYNGNYREHNYAPYNNHTHNQEPYNNPESFQNPVPEHRSINNDRYPSNLPPPLDKNPSSARGYSYQGTPNNYENNQQPMYNRESKQIQSNYQDREPSAPTTLNPANRNSRLSMSNTPAGDGRNQFQQHHQSNNNLAPEPKSDYNNNSPMTGAGNKPISSQPYDTYRSKNLTQPIEQQKSSYYAKNEPSKYEKARSPLPGSVNENITRSPAYKSGYSYNADRPLSSIDNFNSYSSHKDKFRPNVRQWESAYTTRENALNSNTQNNFNDRNDRSNSNEKNISNSARDSYYYDDASEKQHAAHYRESDASRSFPNTPVAADDAQGQVKNVGRPNKLSNFVRDKKYSPDSKEQVLETQPTNPLYNRSKESPKSLDTPDTKRIKSPSYRTPDVNEIRGHSWWADKEASPQSERPPSANKRFPSSGNSGYNRQNPPQSIRKTKNPSTSNFARAINEDEPENRISSRHTSLSASYMPAPVNLPSGIYKAPSANPNSNNADTGKSPSQMSSKSENLAKSDNYDSKFSRPSKDTDQNLENNRTNYLSKSANNYESENQQLVPSKRDNPSNNSKKDSFNENNYSPDNSANQVSDTHSVKSDSGKPLYKRVRSSQNSDYNEGYSSNNLNTTGNARSPISQNDSSKLPAQGLEDKPLSRVATQEPQRSRKNETLERNTSEPTRPHTSAEEPEDGEVFEDDDLNNGSTKDYTHNIKYGENLDNFRALKTVNSSPERTADSYKNETKNTANFNNNPANISPKDGDSKSTNSEKNS
ncbi:General transcriptional corepressor ssn6 [Smittium culicis]|uniref:General transcriptional corepressor ssn6 n=1 Tax=Smittium culicis TaxID=133412 RepID=A0A1R1XSS9_9FUNG|nr:General transcriptional corepressor ssn6 [Smittium culicis]